MKYDIKKIPFSTYGSYLVIGHLNGFEQSEDLYIRSVHTQERGKSIFKISMEQNGKKIDFLESADEAVLTLTNQEGNAKCEITFEDRNTLRIRVQNCSICLTADHLEDYQLAYPTVNDQWELNIYSHKMQLVPLQGNYKIDAPWKIAKSEYVNITIDPDDSGVGEAALEEYLNVWKEKKERPEFTSCVHTCRNEYEIFLKYTLPVPKKYEKTRQEAAYLNWSSVVHAENNFQRDAMLMSKNWMTNVWSWDHCFNAMALAKGNPKSAYEQFMIMFDFQDDTGSLPDCVSDAGMIRNFVKPPVHGLTALFLLENQGCLDEHMEEVYEALKKWTQWWFDYRDFDQDGIPQYHHGNDSGWDNATVFGESPVVEGVDLSAFLVLQYEALGKMAEKLNKMEEARKHKKDSELLLQRMKEHFERGGIYKSLQCQTHEPAKGDCLLDCMPIVLGERLPVQWKQSIVQTLKQPGRFLTGYGLATESVTSPFYIADGYWRGPIWAPSTYLIWKGLTEINETELAVSIAEKFCDMCVDGGFAENFDALSGKGLRDRAYTWTSSVFLLLANSLLDA